MDTRSRVTVGAAGALLMALGCRDAQSPNGSSTTPNPEVSALSAVGQKVVNSLADPGNGVCTASQCTLREAIEDPTSTAISFAPALTGPITLAAPAQGGGSLVIDKPLAITGPASGLIVRRRSTDPAFRILRIGTSGVVRLENLTLRNGSADVLGGGIISFGTLTLSHCSIDNNAAGEHGGGIDNHGTLRVTNSTISHNSARRAAGIHNHNNGTLELTASTVTGNSGGGVANDGSTIVLRNSTVSNNSGEGIFALRGSDTLEFIKVLDNTEGGIVVVNGRLRLTNSTVARNSSGGIANIGGSVAISKSTIVGNTTSGTGGGIFNTVENVFGRGSADLRLTNSTVARNSAARGGGIHNTDEIGGASIIISNSTIVFNSASDAGGGILQEGAPENGNSLSLVNSVVAGNSAPVGPDMSDDANEGSFVSARFNLIGDGTGSGLTNTDGNQVGKVAPHTTAIDPRLGLLQLNGGVTRSYALLAGSPAIDAASAADCPAKDQREVSRPQGPACDIGSFERQ